MEDMFTGVVPLASSNNHDDNHNDDDDKDDDSEECCAAERLTPKPPLESYNQPPQYDDESSLRPIISES